MPKIYTIVLTEKELDYFRDRNVYIALNKAGMPIHRAREIAETAHEIEILPPKEEVKSDTPPIPSGLDYLNQDYWWKSSDKGWIPITEMHPKHAANAYLWAIEKGHQLYDAWNIKTVPTGKALMNAFFAGITPDYQWDDKMIGKKFPLSKEERLGIVVNSKLIKAVGKFAKDNGGFNIPN